MPDLIRFGPFELDVEAAELRSEGRNLRLPEQQFRILHMLLLAEGGVVTREEIRRQLWPNDTVVEFDRSINTAMMKLRIALGDTGDKARLIETLVRRGYRLLVPVEREQSRLATPPVRELRQSSLVGQKVSHYRVLGILGGGGMGVVYKGEDLKLNRPVALKFLPEEIASDPLTVQRFEREARTASALNHPNICTIYEVEEYDGQPFLVMELLEGETLRERIARFAFEANGEPRGLPLAQVFDISLQIAEGLSAAHAKGIIHRDIKPSNIFVTPSGRVKILDFGLAKAGAETGQDLSTDAANDLTLSQTGVSMGTAGYMSPEQVRGERLDARTDLFSFGLILYEMAAGSRPFRGRTPMEIGAAILRDAPSPPPGRLPAGLKAVILRSLEKSPEDRWSSAADLRTALEEARRTSQDVQPSSPNSARVKKAHRAGGTRFWIVAAALIAVLLLGGVGFFFWSEQDKRLTAKDSVVLADFSNSTGDPIFDDTLKTALSISLRQSPFLKFVPGGKIADTLRMMGRPADAKLTPEVTRELCQRANAKVMIAGAIGSLGSEYVIGLKAVACHSGGTLAEEQSTVLAKDKVVDALGSMATRLRGELGESLATVQRFDVPLAHATTPSLDALKQYSLGLKAAQDKGPPADIPYDLRAIEIDPNFAVGYLVLGNAYASVGELGRASEYLTKAFQLRDHADQREKLQISGDYYSVVTGELDKSVQIFREEIEDYPEEPAAYGNLGTAYAALGQYEKAAEITRQCMRIPPNDSSAYANLAGDLLAEQQFDASRQAIERARALKMDNFAFHTPLYALAFLGADSAAMAEQLQWFAARPEYEVLGLGLAADSEAYMGHLSKAQKIGKQVVDSAVRSDNKETGAIFRAIAAQRDAAFGDFAQARQGAEEALKLAPGSQGVESESALALAMAGDTARAGPLADDLAKRYPLDTQMQTIWLPSIHAQLALARNNPAQAVGAMKSASEAELGQIAFVDNVSCLYPAYVRGEAFLAAGQSSAAAQEFQTILDHSGIVWNCWTGAMSRLGVARANALKARTSKGADADAARVRALAAYKDFLALWKDADPGIPVLAAARAEYERLL